MKHIVKASIKRFVMLLQNLCISDLNAVLDWSWWVRSFQLSFSYFELIIRLIRLDLSFHQQKFLCLNLQPTDHQSRVITITPKSKLRDTEKRSIDFSNVSFLPVKIHLLISFSSSNPIVFIIQTIGQSPTCDQYIRRHGKMDSSEEKDSQCVSPMKSHFLQSMNIYQTPSIRWGRSV